MYNYKLNEYDLADQMMHQMKKDNKIKKTLDTCTIFFSVVIATISMIIINYLAPQINLIILGVCAIILAALLALLIMKNYRVILAIVFRREVNKKSDDYDLTLEVIGRKLKLYRRIGDEEFIINEIKCEESVDTTYVISNGRIIIIPDRIFKSDEEKKEFIKKLKNDK